MKDFKFLIYNTPDENVSINVIIQDETIWLPVESMARLFGKGRSTISEHLKNIFESSELREESTCRKFRHMGSNGQEYNTNCYNLKAVFAVGYRVNSPRAIQFRTWASSILEEYAQKGFVLDDERLKQGKRAFGKDYFKELLERVRSIRASERRIWQQITDIFAECSIDYDKDSPTTKEFYATIQNKFHYAITGCTAAEIIYENADRTRKHMGLTTWKYAPDGRVLKSDVTIAKNYLSEKNIKKLERTVSGYFDYIEDIIENERSFNMQEFAESVNKFLEFREYKILTGKGKVSKEQADRKACREYDEFNKTQKIVSDFDKEIKKLLKSESGE